MSLIECKCPNCGAEVKINPSEEASYCEYCGKAFITEKAINVNGDYVKEQNIINNVKQDNEYSIELEKVRDKIKNKNAFIFYMSLLLVFILAMLYLHFF